MNLNEFLAALKKVITDHVLLRIKWVCEEILRGSAQYTDDEYIEAMRQYNEWVRGK